MEAVLLRKNTAFPGRSQSVMGASMNADARGRTRTTQSAIFEGSRLSQCRRASASIHACTCTSQQELDQCVLSDVAPGYFIASAHVLCDITNDIIFYTNDVRI